MNSLQRIATAIALQKPDRVPVIAQVFGHAAALAGVPLDEYVRDGATLARCQLAAWKRYGYDAVFAVMDVNVETEAIGSILRYRPNQYPVVERYVLAQQGDASALALPDPQRAGRMPQMLQALGILRGELGDRVLVVGCVLGPLTLTVQLLGLETALYLAIDDAPRLERILDFSTEVLLRFGQAQIRSGADLPLVFDPAASPAVVPPQFFREFEVPRLQRLFQASDRGGHSGELAPYRRSRSRESCPITQRPGSTWRISITASVPPKLGPCFRPPAWMAIFNRYRLWKVILPRSRRRPWTFFASSAAEPVSFCLRAARFHPNPGRKMSPRWSILCALLGEQVPKLTVLTNDIAREVPFAHKSSVRQILETAGLGCVPAVEETGRAGCAWSRSKREKSTARRETSVSSCLPKCWNGRSASPAS